MIGQASSADPAQSPVTDGSGTGVPTSTVISNVTNLANAVAVDVAGVYRTVNSPPPATTYTLGQGYSPVGSIGLIPILLIVGAGFLIFKAVEKP